MIGGLTAFIIGLKLFPLLPKEISWQANLILGIGLSFLILGTANLYGFSSLEKLNKWVFKISGRLKITSTQLVFLSLSLLLSFCAALAAGTSGIMRHQGLSIGCWIAALLLFILGGWQADEPFPKPTRKTWGIALVLFLVSTLVRSLALTDIPPLLNGDEASAGLSAAAFLGDSSRNIFGVSWFSFPSLFFYLQSFFIQIFGQTTFAIRFPSAIAGGLTVSVVYLIGKRIFSERAGLLAAIFLAGSHFHNHFSRIALNNIFDGFWYLLSLGMLWDGWKNQRRSSFLAAGLSFGLAQYFYASSRFLIGIIAVWVLVTIVIQQKKLIGNRTNLALLILAFVVVVLPLGLFFIEHPDDFMAPFVRVQGLGDWLSTEVQIRGEPAWKILSDQLIASAKTLISKPSEVWYSPRVPILRPVSAGIFIAGLILLGFRLRRSSSLLLLIWIGSFVLIGGLSVPVSSAQRYVAVLPACALVIGFAMDEIASLLEINWKIPQKWLTVISLAIITAVGVSDLYFYLFTYTPISSMGGTNTLVAQRLADDLQDKEDLQVAFFGSPRMGYYSIRSTQYLAPHIEGLDFIHPWGSEGNPQLTAGAVIFIFLPGNEENLSLVIEDYPIGTKSIEQNVDDSVLYWSYTVNNFISP
ncbi:MAG: glycosyltransferase family 39 protein [Chloroflexota bacterium]